MTDANVPGGKNLRVRAASPSIPDGQAKEENRMTTVFDGLSTHEKGSSPAATS
ncbi:hypothetical protein HGG72_00670 [Ochrobactrum pecoris]|nr:hypothetical protein [Brucella pecoris]